MAILTWYTQPPASFASYYYFDTDTRNMVRVRLELNRKDQGAPKAIPDSDRYIGFVDPGTGIKFDYDPQYWSVNGDGLIVYHKGSDKVTLTDNPTVGWKIIDFSMGGSHIHHGNKVTDNPVLPSCSSPSIVINETILEGVVQKTIGGTRVEFCAYNATECQLCQGIMDVYQS